VAGRASVPAAADAAARPAQALADRVLADGRFAGAGLAMPQRLDSAAAEGPGWALPRRGVDPWLPRLGPIASAAQALRLQSFYSRWIVADIPVWGESGITAVWFRRALCILLVQYANGNLHQPQIIPAQLTASHTQVTFHARRNVLAGMRPNFRSNCCSSW